MQALLISVALFAQSDLGIPPAPAPAVEVSSNPRQTAEEMRTWLLARLVIDSAFDEKKSAEAQRLLSTMNEQQLTALVEAYKERAPRPAPAAKSAANSTLTATQQQELDQARLNLQQAEAYRDHLKREYDRRLLQGQMTQNLVYQNIVNNQMLMYRTNGMFGYGVYGVSPLGFGGLGYGVLNYGGWGYGAPVFGGGFVGAPRVW
jgi:hypothetical protein